MNSNPNSNQGGPSNAPSHTSHTMDFDPLTFKPINPGGPSNSYDTNPNETENRNQEKNADPSQESESARARRIYNLDGGTIDIGRPEVFNPDLLSGRVGGVGLGSSVGTGVGMGMGSSAGMHLGGDEMDVDFDFNGSGLRLGGEGGMNGMGYESGIHGGMNLPMMNGMPLPPQHMQMQHQQSRQEDHYGGPPPTLQVQQHQGGLGVAYGNHLQPQFGPGPGMGGYNRNTQQQIQPQQGDPGSYYRGFPQQQFVQPQMRNLQQHGVLGGSYGNSQEHIQRQRPEYYTRNSQQHIPQQQIGPVYYNGNPQQHQFGLGAFDGNSHLQVPHQQGGPEYYDGNPQQQHFGFGPGIVDGNMFEMDEIQQQPIQHYQHQAGLADEFLSMHAAEDAMQDIMGPADMSTQDQLGYGRPLNMNLLPNVYPHPSQGSEGPGFPLNPHMGGGNLMTPHPGQLMGNEVAMMNPSHTAHGSYPNIPTDTGGGDKMNPPSSDSQGVPGFSTSAPLQQTLNNLQRQRTPRNLAAFAVTSSDGGIRQLRPAISTMGSQVGPQNQPYPANHSPFGANQNKKPLEKIVPQTFQPGNPNLVPDAQIQMPLNNGIQNGLPNHVMQQPPGNQELARLEALYNITVVRIVKANMAQGLASYTAEQQQELNGLIRQIKIAGGVNPVEDRIPQYPSIPVYLYPERSVWNVGMQLPISSIGRSAVYSQVQQHNAPQNQQQGAPMMQQQIPPAQAALPTDLQSMKNTLAQSRAKVQENFFKTASEAQSERMEDPATRQLSAQDRAAPTKPSYTQTQIPYAQTDGYQAQLNAVEKYNAKRKLETLQKWNRPNPDPQAQANDKPTRKRKANQQSERAPVKRQRGKKILLGKDEEVVVKVEAEQEVVIQIEPGTGGDNGKVERKGKEKEIEETSAFDFIRAFSASTRFSDWLRGGFEEVLEGEEGLVGD